MCLFLRTYFYRYNKFMRLRKIIDSSKESYKKGFSCGLRFKEWIYNIYNRLNAGIYSGSVNKKAVKNFKSELLLKIMHYRYRNKVSELGGTLIGYWVRRSAYVFDFIFSQNFRADLREQYITENESLIMYLSDLNINTKGKLKYIGDWHLHTSGVDIPSEQDNKVMFKRARVMKRALLMIVTTNKAVSELWITAYLYTRWGEKYNIKIL